MRNFPTDGFDSRTRLAPLDTDALFANKIEGCSDEEAKLENGEPVELDAQAIAEYTVLYRDRMKAAYNRPARFDRVDRDLINLGILMDAKHPLETRSSEYDFDEEEIDEAVDPTSDKWAQDRADLEEYLYYVDGERRAALGLMRRLREAEDGCVVQEARSDRRGYVDGSERDRRRASRAMKQSRVK